MVQRPICYTYWCSFSLGWDETGSTQYINHLYLLYQPGMMMKDDECGAVSGMRIGRGSRSTRRKPAPVLLCPPQIPHLTGLVAGKPVTDCLSYGMDLLVSVQSKFRNKFHGSEFERVGVHRQCVLYESQFCFLYPQDAIYMSTDYIALVCLN
jgi:hypothetical protein